MLAKAQQLPSVSQEMPGRLISGIRQCGVWGRGTQPHAWALHPPGKRGYCQQAPAEREGSSQEGGQAGVDWEELAEQRLQLSPHGPWSWWEEEETQRFDTALLQASWAHALRCGDPCLLIIETQTIWARTAFLLF